MSNKLGYWKLLKALLAARRAKRRYEKGDHDMGEDFKWSAAQSKQKANERTGRSAVGFGIGGAVVGALAFIRHLWPDLLWPEANDTEVLSAATVLWAAVMHVYLWARTYVTDKAKYQAIEAEHAYDNPVEFEKL